MTILINDYVGVDEIFAHPRYTVIILAVATRALNLGAGGVAFAATPDWRDAPYPYTIVNQDVTDIVKTFGYNTGLKVSVAQDVKGTVHGQESARTAGDFLNEITNSNDLDWYSDGTVVYVSPAANEETATVSLNEFPFDELERRLASFGLLDKRFRLSKRKAGDVIILSGPPSYDAPSGTAPPSAGTPAAAGPSGANTVPDGTNPGAPTVSAGSGSNSTTITNTSNHDEKIRQFLNGGSTTTPTAEIDLKPGQSGTLNYQNGQGGFDQEADSSGKYQSGASRLEFYAYQNGKTNDDVSYIGGRNASISVSDGQGHTAGDTQSIATNAPAGTVTKDAAGNPTIQGWYDGSAPGTNPMTMAGTPASTTPPPSARLIN